MEINIGLTVVTFLAITGWLAAYICWLELKRALKKPLLKKKRERYLDRLSAALEGRERTVRR